MADEKIVATVYYKGVNKGAASITVEDTSSLSNYAFRIYNADTDATTDPQLLRQLNKYIVRITDQNSQGQPKDVYLTWSCPDGKFLGNGATQAGGAVNRNETLTLPSNGIGYIPFSTDYFPSASGYTGKLDIYHDAARTLLIRTFNFTVQSINTPYIRIVPERNANGGTSYPPTIKMGENFVVRIDAIGVDKLPANFVAKYAGAVGNESLTSSSYIVPVGSLEMSVSKPDTAAHYIGSQTLGTNIQNAGVAGRLITVRMGDVTHQNELVNVGMVNAGPYEAKTTPVSVNLLHRGGSFTDYAFFFAQGIHKDSFKSGMLCSVTFAGSNYPNVTVGAYVPAIGDSSAGITTRAWLGQIAPLAVKPSDLTTLVSRRQFGKYQNLTTRFYDRETAWVRTYEWKDLTDSISDAQYGVVSDLKNSDIVVLPQPQNRAEVTRIWFASNTKINIEVAWTPNGSGGSTYYTGNVSVLFLRSSELLENHEPGTPYPRIVKAGRAAITNGVCTIDIPASSTINLTESRYVVQHAIEAGSDAYSTSNDTAITFEPKRVTLKSQPNISGVYTRHYAIWDLGPGLIQFVDK